MVFVVVVLICCVIEYKQRSPGTCKEAVVNSPLVVRPFLYWHHFVSRGVWCSRKSFLTSPCWIMGVNYYKSFWFTFMRMWKCTWSVYDFEWQCWRVKWGVNPITAHTSMWVRQIYAILQQLPKLWAVITYDTDRFRTDYSMTHVHIPGNNYPHLGSFCKVVWLHCTGVRYQSERWWHSTR